MLFKNDFLIMKKLIITKDFLLFCLFNQLLYTKTPYIIHLEIDTMYDAIIYEATYGRTLTIKWPHAAIWPPVPHPYIYTLARSHTDREMI